MDLHPSINQLALCKKVRRGGAGAKIGVGPKGLIHLWANSAGDGGGATCSRRELGGGGGGGGAPGTTKATDYFTDEDLSNGSGLLISHRKCFSPF